MKVVSTPDRVLVSQWPAKISRSDGDDRFFRG